MRKERGRESVQPAGAVKWEADTRELTQQAEEEELTRGGREDITQQQQKQLKQRRESGWHCLGKVHPAVR